MAGETEQTILVRILANIDGVLGGMKGASAAVAENTQAMKGAFGSLTATIDKMKAPFLAITSIMAGGKVFKDAVAATQEWTYSSILLARQLGITAEQASVLKVALDDSFVTTEQYSKAVQMMTRNIAQGGKGFERLGIDTKDANGHLKSSGDLMTEVLAKLNTLKAGTDRNVAGTAIFSRSWAEASKLLVLNAEVMEEARVKAEKLNLIVGENAVEAGMRYKKAMQEAGDVTEGLKIAIGRQLLPILSAFTEWMSETGPGAVEIISNVMKGFVQVIYTLQYALNQVGNILVGIVSMAADVGTTLGAFFFNLARGDVAGALTAISGGIDDVKDTWRTTLDTMGNDTEDLVRKTNELWNPAKKAAKVERPGTTNFDPDAGNDDKILAAFKLQLEQKKALEENWFSWNDSRELEFWREKLKKVTVGSKAYLAILSEVNKLRKSIAQQEKKDQKEIDDEIRALQLDALKGREKLLLEGLTAEEAAIASRRSLNEISAEQEVAALIAVEDRKYAIKRESLLAQLAVEKLTAKELQQLHQEADLLDAQHKAAVAGIVAKGAQEQLAETQAMFAPLVSGWNTALAGMLSNTMSFTQAIGNIWKGLGQVLDRTIATMLNTWIGAEAKKLAIYIAGKVKALAIHTSTATAAAAVTAGTATAEVGSQAAVAGAGAAASAAQIPGIGWMIAIPAALAVIAGVMAMKGSISSAAGGWAQVPNDQLAAVHKNEMILPAPLAESVRQMAQNGGGGAGGGDIHIHAMDAGSFLTFAQQNRKAFATVVKDLVRNGALSPRTV